MATIKNRLHCPTSLRKASMKITYEEAERLFDLEDEFEMLIGEDHPEEKYQKAIENNTRLVPREFVQNHDVHFDIVLRKLALARDYVTDFFFLAKSSADWNCVLIEIEKPSSKYFKDGTLDFHDDFLAGLKQISRWRAWFENQDNFNGFVNGTLEDIRVPVNLKQNPCFIKYVLVTGRRSEFENDPARRRLIRTQERDDFKIISYDSLLEGMRFKRPLYLGVRRNEYYEVFGSEYAGDNLFVYLPAHRLRISQQLLNALYEQRGQWFVINPSTGNHFLEDVLPSVAVI